MHAAARSALNVDPAAANAEPKPANLVDVHETARSDVDMQPVATRVQLEHSQAF